MGHRFSCAACDETAAVVTTNIDGLVNAPLLCTENCVDSLVNSIREERLREGAVSEGAFEQHGLSRAERNESQSHLLKFMKEIGDPSSQESLLAEYSLFDWTDIRQIGLQAVEVLENKVDPDIVFPPRRALWLSSAPIFCQGANVLDHGDIAPRRFHKLISKGLQLIGSSAVAVFILAGSGDRRIGRGKPVGCADIGLVSGKSLFQIYCERVRRIQHLGKRCLMARSREFVLKKEQWLSAQSKKMRKQLGKSSHSGGGGPPERTELEESLRQHKDPEASDEEESDMEDFCSERPEIEKRRKALQANRRAGVIGIDKPIFATGGTDVYQQLRREVGEAFECNERWKNKNVSAVGKDSSSAIHSERGVVVPVYVVCSRDNVEEIKEHFEGNDFFGLLSENVTFFVQGVMPALDKNGNAFLEEKHRIGLHPNGSGGLFRAAADEGILMDLKNREIEHIFVMSQDNLLAKVSDPAFVGFCDALRVPVAVKCIRKDSMDDTLGYFVTVQKSGKDTDGDGIATETNRARYEAAILEPQEMNYSSRHLKDSKHNFVFDVHSMSQFYFAFAQFEKCCAASPRWHAIPRRQPYINVSTGALVTPEPQAKNAFRIETFVGDALTNSKAAVALVVPRHGEWAYAKQVNPVDQHSTKAAVFAMSLVHYGWVTKAGGLFADSGSVEMGSMACEVSPLVSYNGEDLEGHFPHTGPRLRLPYYHRGVEEENALEQKVEREEETHLLSSNFVQDGGLMESREKAYIVHGMNITQPVERKQLARKSFFIGDVASFPVSRSSSRVPSSPPDIAEPLPGTPDGLADERDNWQDKMIEATRKYIHLQQELCEGHASDTDSDKDPLPAFQTLAEDGDDWDVFAITLNNPCMRGVPLAKMPKTSNLFSRGHSGFHRKPAHKSATSSLACHTLFGVGSGYKRAKRTHVHQVKKKRDERWLAKESRSSRVSKSGRSSGKSGRSSDGSERMSGGSSGSGVSPGRSPGGSPSSPGDSKQRMGSSPVAYISRSDLLKLPPESRYGQWVRLAPLKEQGRNVACESILT